MPSSAQQPLAGPPITLVVGTLLW
uniref:Putative polyol transporter 1 n=1 Tax=Rhizophora mucronata TaxID=61149 RepID=A0A2P2JGX6_RHIMU